MRGKKPNAKHIHAGYNSHLRSFTIVVITVRTMAAPNPTSFFDDKIAEEYTPKKV